MLDKNPKLPLASLTNYIVSLVGDQDTQIYEDIFRELASYLGMDYKEYISAYSLGGVVESFFGFFSDYKERVRYENLNAMIHNLQEVSKYCNSLANKYLCYLDSAKNALRVKMFEQAQNELKNLLKIIREDLVNMKDVKDILLATKLRIVLTIVIQSYDSGKKQSQPFFLFNNSVKKFIALEIVSCIKSLSNVQKTMEDSFYFKLAKFFNYQQDYADIEHEMCVILKKSYEFISNGMCLTKFASQIGSSGFKTIPQFLPTGSLYAVQVPVGLQHENEMLELLMWKSSDGVFVFHPKTAHF